MTWTKLSDDFADDCWELSDKAFRLHVEGLTWSNRKLLDLVMSKKAVYRFATHPEALAELVARGMWEENGDCVVILHHGAYQRTRDKVIAQQIANTTNQARRGKATPAPREIVEKPKGVVFAESPTRNDSLNKSLNKSLNDSSNERDRLGRLIGEDNKEDESAASWSVVAIPGQVEERSNKCFVCRAGLELSLPRQSALCELKDDAHNAAFALITKREGKRHTG